LVARQERHAFGNPVVEIEAVLTKERERRRRDTKQLVVLCKLAREEREIERRAFERAVALTLHRANAELHELKHRRRRRGGAVAIVDRIEHVVTSLFKVQPAQFGIKRNVIGVQYSTADLVERRRKRRSVHIHFVMSYFVGVRRVPFLAKALQRSVARQTPFMLTTFKFNSNNNNNNNNNNNSQHWRFFKSKVLLALPLLACAAASDEFKEPATGLPFPRKIENGNVFIGASGYLFIYLFFVFCSMTITSSSNRDVLEIQGIRDRFVFATARFKCHSTKCTTSDG
jgi:hypothetical protein